MRYLLVVGLLLAEICGGPDPPIPTLAPIDFTMTAAEFHRFGALSGAPEGPSGSTAAESLGEDPDAVHALMTELCANSANQMTFPPLSWPAFPEAVPAYEQFFQELEGVCSSVILSSAFDRLRAQVANRIAARQLALEDLGLSQDQTTSFCDFLSDNQDITTSLLATALEAADVIPEGGGHLAEIGLAVLIVSCPDLVDLLG